MNDNCHYCKKYKEVEDFEHPLTFQIHPTCTECKTKLLATKTYEFERNIFSKIGCFSILIIVFFLILFVINKSTIFIYILLLSIFVCTVSFLGVEYFVRKRDKNFGFDPSKYKWCKTCKYFKKVKNWDYKFSQSKEIVDSILIPCKIEDLTQEVWNKYFTMSPEERKLYPDFCDNWLKK